MAISEIKVQVDCRVRKHAMLVIALGHFAIRLGADPKKTTSWIVRHAFNLTVT